MISSVSSCTRTLILVGLLTTLFALILLSTLPSIVHVVLSKELQIGPGTKNFEHWKSTPVPMYVDIYFFNWTNSKKVETETPHFDEVGPYRFYEKRTKVGLVWNANNTVTYRQVRHWWFDPDNSNGSLTDVINTVNVIPLVVANLYRYKDYLEKAGVSFGLISLKQKVDMSRTVEELLFRGYDDDVLSLINRFPFLSKAADKFGWFFQRNGSETHDGVFNMNTGEDDITKLGSIRNWNYRTHTGFFKGECGVLGGSTGEVFPPGVHPSSRLALFSPDLCRTIHLEYVEDTTVLGVDGLTFRASPRLHDYQEKSCYCTGDCPPVGLHNLTFCRQGAPLFMSYPHFYLADPQLLQQVSGLSPSRDLHEFQMTVQPILGAPIDVKARFQLNMMIEPDQDIKLYRYIPRRLYIPVMWLDQRATLTEELGAEVRHLTSIPDTTRLVVSAFLFLGLLVFLSSLVRAGVSLFGSPVKAAPDSIHGRPQAIFVVHSG